ncbi:endonuclease I [Fluviicoccus keumensis]|uniref:Endonuclease I n=1 Tax=Fluviicoccus keumensis TaxID=1435465 RepID=A0A4Q7Z5D9_9GAMM|nr:endonuclease I [Fluviicoccus keumensis]
MKRYWIVLLCLFLQACSLDDLRHLVSGETDPAIITAPGNLPHTPATFDQAKKILYSQIYQGHALTFYCGCEFDAKSRKVNEESCGYKPRKNPERASRIEAEHVMPAHQFGNFRQCWREPEKVCGSKMSGRKCCEEKDPLFTTAHNDLNNLYPAIGEVNGDRSNYNWGEVPGEKREYGACTIEIDESIRRVEPPEYDKGEIARTMFYMEKTYGFKLSDQDRKLYEAWNRMDPPDDWEQERNRRIAKIQGQDNPFISHYGETPESIRTGKPAETASQGVTASPAAPTAPVAAPPEVTSGVKHPSGGFSCKPIKSCSKMSSCEEAMFQLRQCGNTAIDGNGDGIPCASICRKE